MFKKMAFLSPTLFLMAMSVDVKAGIVSSNNSSFSWGRAQFSAAEATENLGTAGSDVMLPVYGNVNGFAYGDAMGDYGTDGTYIASPGIGYRGLYNNQIFGAYFFGDYQETSLGTHFWVLSPGIEWITPEWDAHANGYFPTTTRQQSGSSNFANTFGDDSNVTFEKGTNNQYDELVAPYAVVGNGVDAAVGYSFDPNGDHLRSHVSLGAYYYQAPSDSDVDNITGLTASYSNAVTHNLSVSMTNSYDQINHYNVSMSLTYTFGGESNIFSQNVKDRLLDPVERHIGIIATGAGQYDQQSLENQGMGLEYDNVYFASVDGTGNGTYGNPMALDQESIDNTYSESQDGARIYIQGGSSEIYNLGTDPLSLYDGQDLYGRTADYTAPADTGERPQINADEDAFILRDGGENTFSDLDIYSSGGGTGIYAINSSSADEVLTMTNTNVSGFATGVYVDNRGAGDFTINATNSQFNDNVATLGSSAYGMEVFNSGSGDVVVNATNSQFNNNSGDNSGYGLYLVNQGSGELTLNATESQFNNNSGTTSAYGVFAQNDNGANQLTIDADQSTFNNNTAAQAIGFYASNASANDLIVDVYDSEFNDNNGANTASGLYVKNISSGELTVDVTASQFNGNNAGSYAYGLYAGNTSTGQLTINADESSFDSNMATSNGAYVYGLYSLNTSSGYLEVNLTNTSFNQNTASGANSYANGMNATNSGSGELNVYAVDSEFNNNTAGDGSNGYAAGFLANNSNDGELQVNVSNSEFNNNSGGDYGMGMMVYNTSGVVTVSATSSEFSSNSLDGLYVNNQSTSSSSLTVTDLSGSTFNNNGVYGIYNYTEEPDTVTQIDLAGATFEGVDQYDYNW